LRAVVRILIQASGADEPTHNPRAQAVLVLTGFPSPIDSPPMSKPTTEAGPILPERVRKLPGHFAWADHRLRDRLARLSLEEIALLFFLHLAADKAGCSFWAESTVAKRLGLKEGEVIQARHGLVSKGFIAYRYPLFQILDLPEESA
jgi:hypothetical protein